MNTQLDPATRALAAANALETARQRIYRRPWPAGRAYAPQQVLEKAAYAAKERLDTLLYEHKLEEAETLAATAALELETEADRLLKLAQQDESDHLGAVEAARLAKFVSSLTPEGVLDAVEKAGAELWLAVDGGIVADIPERLHSDLRHAIQHHAEAVKERLRKRAAGAPVAQ